MSDIYSSIRNFASHKGMKHKITITIKKADIIQSMKARNRAEHIAEGVPIRSGRVHRDKSKYNRKDKSWRNGE